MIASNYSIDNTISISVIMMSYLDHYPGARSNPIERFHRSIRSFMMQTHSEKELIIVSDGCQKTIDEYNKHWSDVPFIKLIECSKSKFKWPGSQRQIGINNATGDWICYLDTDDVIHPTHLSNIEYTIRRNPGIEVMLNRGYARLLKDDELDLSIIPVVLNNMTIDMPEIKNYRELSDIYNYVEINFSLIPKVSDVYGSSRTMHRRDIPIKCIDSNTRGEDVRYSNMLKSLEHILINTPTYIVCHIPNIIDL